MKPTAIISGIVVVTVLFGGAFALRTKLKYDADGKAIKGLIADYKALGIPTTTDELYRPLSPQEDSWSELGPLLLNKNGTGNGPLYRSGIAGELVRAGTKNDLPILKRYLAENQAARDKITKALMSKPRFWVPHEYGKGFEVLLPEYAVFKSVCRDYVLEAYVAGLEGNRSKMLDNFRYANRFATHCMERNELIGVLVGIAIQKMMIFCAFQLIEQDPSLRPSLAPYFTSPEFIVKSDLKRLFEGEFVAQVVSCRYLDSPLIDRRVYPSPMDKVFKTPTQEEIIKAARVRNGDYMPESANMRSFLRNRLEAWKPFMTEVATYKPDQKLPPGSLFSTCFDFTSNIPPALSYLNSYVAPSDSFYVSFGMDAKYRDLYRVIWKALEIKSTTGKYPPTMAATGVTLSPITQGEDFDYSVSSKGVVIKSVRLMEGSDRPAISIGFPISLVRNDDASGALSNSRGTLEKYRDGKIDWKGADARRSGSSPSLPHGVPGASAPTSP